MKFPLAGAMVPLLLLAVGCSESYDDTPRSAVIQGWVTNAESGDPVGEASVCAERASDDSRSCTRSEDTEGFYRITARWLPNKDQYIRVTAEKEGYRIFRRRVRTLDLESVAAEPIPDFPYILNIRLYPEN